jgi:hypothetical protein
MSVVGLSEVIDVTEELREAEVCVVASIALSAFSVAKNLCTIDLPATQPSAVNLKMGTAWTMR